MKEEGYTEYKGMSGRTFPGIDPEDIERAIANANKDKQVLPDPKMTLKRITNNGHLELEFDQKMLFPKASEIDPEFYEKAIEIGIVRASDEKLIKGRFVRDKYIKTDENEDQRKLDGSNSSFDKEAEEKFDFMVKILKHTANNMDF